MICVACIADKHDILHPGLLLRQNARSAAASCKTKRLAQPLPVACGRSINTTSHHGIRQAFIKVKLKVKLSLPGCIAGAGAAGARAGMSWPSAGGWLRRAAQDGDAAWGPTTWTCRCGLHGPQHSLLLHSTACCAWLHMAAYAGYCHNTGHAQARLLPHLPYSLYGAERARQKAFGGALFNPHMDSRSHIRCGCATSITLISTCFVLLCRLCRGASTRPLRCRATSSTSCAAPPPLRCGRTWGRRLCRRCRASAWHKPERQRSPDCNSDCTHAVHSWQLYVATLGDHTYGQWVQRTPQVAPSAVMS